VCTKLDNPLDNPSLGLVVDVPTYPPEGFQYLYDCSSTFTNTSIGYTTWTAWNNATATILHEMVSGTSSLWFRNYFLEAGATQILASQQITWTGGYDQANYDFQSFVFASTPTPTEQFLGIYRFAQGAGDTKFVSE
jgi:hypothetical protein